MTRYYRATIALEEISNIQPDGIGTVEPIAQVMVTAGSPGSALSQILPHVDQLVGWHQEQTTVKEDAKP